jgi:D-alanine-D-alanine ligase
VPALTELEALDLDVALSVLHGGAGEGGIVPGILELLGIALVGSDATSSAVSMDKSHAKDVLRGAGIPVARDFAWMDGGSASPKRPSDSAIASLGGYPVVVKPFAEGSTFGISIVRSETDWPRAAEVVRPFLHRSRGAMVERYIPGRELTAAVLLGVALPVVEISPREGFYDFERKYTSGASHYTVPADLPGPLTAQMQSWARRAYRALGCQDLVRVDFRLADDGEIACLELNTLPGMTRTSLFPMAADAVGIDFSELLDILCRTAAKRRSE